MNIGQRIAAARKNAGIAQFELAEIANIRYNTIARIENGTLEPRLDLLEQIADILQVPMSVLLFGDETIDINITSRTLGWRIRMLRKESRMTQPELAQKAGISLTMLRQWELHPAIIANDRLADRIWEARNRGNDDYARRITVVQNQINTAISCLEVFRGADWIRK